MPQIKYIAVQMGTYAIVFTKNKSTQNELGKIPLVYLLLLINSIKSLSRIQLVIVLRSVLMILFKENRKKV